MLPEEPVCTCLSRPIPGLPVRMRKILVIDPFCQIPVHKIRGSYEGPEPEYEKQEGASGTTE
ncbi:hypothetical protein SEA_SNEK_65 [Arthrobacter phage Snek]|uniref:Uncharacterized protein n=1 Tax=Arthrobacter phage Tweety19 TaxID=2768133 RepID=A0A7G9W262_9CAUD|nr:hypothetical protein PQE19_gp43 [Arthrobacter phage Tweety19]QNO12725.1 hypothetical protein SEA_TWEETY19_66 [Arthrobacter phage Tweety19]